MAQAFHHSILPLASAADRRQRVESVMETLDLEKFRDGKGMDPAVVKAIHDAFKKAMDEPKHHEVLAQLNQAAWYRTGAEYKQWAIETYAKDKKLIERLGLAAK